MRFLHRPLYNINANISVPYFFVLSRPPLEEFDHIAVFLNVDLNAALAQEPFVSSEVCDVADHDARYPKLHNRAGAHHARAERGVERTVCPPPEQPGVAEAVGLTVQDDRALLLAPVVTLGDDTAVVDQACAHRNAAFPGAFHGLDDGTLHEFGIEGIHRALPCRCDRVRAMVVARGAALNCVYVRLYPLSHNSQV